MDILPFFGMANVWVIFFPKIGPFFLNFWTCLGSLGDTSKYRIIPYLFVALVVEAKASNVAIAITGTLPI
jgi:hypothetical protein